MYQALYRKYRPIDFDSVVGQDAVVKTLKNSIVHQNFSHAYLFYGPRGTGKTTVSKVFARNINCLDSKDGNACGKCSACQKSFSKNCMDILEIDAASNNGVDEIRDLKSKITFVPNDLKYKVYIIDEVHMLSIGAFNALLKTLEEPPEHAVFILATTDPQKVPETITSRCQCFTFKRISPDVIFDRLSFVCEKEKISIEEEVLKNISLLVEGGMRDALGLLDKLVSYTNQKITMDDFIEVNGIVSKEQLNDFLKCILSGDIALVLTLLQEFDNKGKNLIQIISQLLNFSRNLVVDYYLSQKKLNFSLNLLQDFIIYLNEKMFDIKRSGNTRIYVEVILLKFMNDYVLKKNDIKSEISSNINEEEVVEKSDNKLTKENEIVQEVKDNELVMVNEDKEEMVSVDVLSNNPRILNLSDIMKVRINNTLATADKMLLKNELVLFDKLKDFTFDQEIGYLVCSLLDGKIRVVGPDYMILSFPYDSNVQQNFDYLEKLEEIYQKITTSSKKFAFISDDSWEHIRKVYISNLKNGIKYELQEEPNVVLEEVKNGDIITSSAVELFGDIVEIE